MNKTDNGYVTSSFVIGQVGDTALKVDALKLVNTRAIVQANSGGGKSWLLRVIAEQCAGKMQVVIIDPEGEFATLREKFDFALIGRSGETPIDLRSAALLARKLIELNISAVVNLSDLDDLESKREYLSTFLGSLMSVPQAFWHPVLILIDEAHKFCPEGSAVASSRAVITLMDSGRKRGFAGLLATQRLSKLNKDAAAEGTNVFVGRTWLDLDRDRAGDLLGMRKAESLTLRDLMPGEFYAFGPALEVNGICRFQSAPVQTTHPKPGERHNLVTPRASRAIHEIVAQIGDLPQQAEQEADKLATLQRENAQMRRQLAERKTLPDVPKGEIVVHIPVISESEMENLKQLGEQFSIVTRSIQATLASFSDALKGVNISAQIGETVQRGNKLPAFRSDIERVHIPNDAKRKFPRAERRILITLAQYPNGRTKAQVAILTGYAIKGGGFNNAIGALRGAGFLTGSGDNNLSITEPGLIALGTDWKPLPTGQALYQHWYGQLPKAERTILSSLVQIWPDAMSKDDLARASGYEVSGGGFNNALGKLRTLELIDGRSEIKASDSLFE